MKAGLSSKLCLGAVIVAATTTTARAADCAARASMPWEKAGPGYSGEAIVHGPTCATAVILSVGRRTGNVPMWIDLQPVAGIPSLAAAANASAMSGTLRPWLIEQLQHRDVPKETADREWRARGSGDQAADCSVRVVTPWSAAGPGYTIELFSDGADCDNAAVAVVVRAPDGRPLYFQATDAAVWQVYFRIDNKTDMAKALTDAPKGAATTGDLPEWPAGLGERYIKRGDFATIPAGEFDRTSWNALRAAKRPSLDIPAGLESGSRIVLMQDGRVIRAAIIGQHR